MKLVCACSAICVVAEEGIPERCSSCGRSWRSNLQSYFTADLECMLCGDELGQIESLTWPPRGDVLLHRPRQQSITITRLPQCERCGGYVFASSLNHCWRRVYPDIVAEPPRRGRPSNAVLAARRAESA